MSMINCCCASKWSAYAPTVLRIAVGIIFLLHGYQKLNQYGVDGFAGFLEKLGVPYDSFFSAVVIFIELIGGVALILGIFTHWAAKLLAIVMLAAICIVHWENGFFQENGGYEYVFALLAANISILLSGPGAFALESVFRDKSEG